MQIGVIAHGQRARNRRGAHHQQVGFAHAAAIGLHLLAQCQPLRYAKTVLLVDDGQRQLVKLHLVLNHRMRAHHQLRLATDNARQHLAPLFRLLAAGEPRYTHPQRSKPVQQFPEMLLGQDFGRRHQRTLPAGVDADGGRQRRHHRLAAAHIPLQQPVHGLAELQVLRDFFGYPALSARQGKRQRSQQLFV